MDSLINFRLLADELTQTEFIFFLQNIASTSDGRKTILSCLFKANIGTPHLIRKFTNVISNIINKRQNDDDNHSMDVETTTTTSTITYLLPFALISECASYLQMTEYFKSGRCNRKTYLALRKQPKLTSLLTQKVIPRSFKFNVFRNCQKIILNTQLFMDSVTFQNQLTWKNSDNLRTLILGNSTSMNLFLMRKPVNTSVINQLVLSQLNYPSHSKGTFAQNVQSFMDIMPHFSNLIGLELTSIIFKVANDPSNPFTAFESLIKRNLSQITRLNLGNSVSFKLCQALINSLREQLHALAIPAGFNLIPPSNGWNNLEELVLWHPNIQVLTGFYDNLSKLKRTMITANGWSLYHQWISVIMQQQLYSWSYCLYGHQVGH